MSPVWHEYPKFTYDYDRLLRLCHAYGIVVYVWIEPPQISQKFYNDHPHGAKKIIEEKISDLTGAILLP